MPDPLTISSIIVAIMTAVGFLISKLHPRHLKLCCCCESDCADKRVYTDDKQSPA